MMTYEVHKISTPTGWRDFLELPHRIYRNDPRWVAPLHTEIRKALDGRSNPYYLRAEAQPFVCYRDGMPVARTAVIINYRHWERWKEPTAFFGFFEAENDPEAVAALFDMAATFARDRGATTIEGPFNPNHYSELGLLVENFAEAPRFFETYNPEYYPPLLETAGFRPVKRLHARINHYTDDYVNRRYQNTNFERPSEFTIRPFRLRQMKAELERIREINNDAFSENWHFLPLSRDEYIHASQYLFFVTFPKLVFIVEKGEEPVGVLQCMLNINQILQPLRGRLKPWHYPGLLLKRQRIQEIVIYAIGIKKEYQHSFVIKLMLDRMIRVVQKYPVVSTTWMTEDNLPAIQASRLLGLEPYKWFAIYGKELVANS